MGFYDRMFASPVRGDSTKWVRVSAGIYERMDGHYLIQHNPVTKQWEVIQRIGKTGMHLVAVPTLSAAKAHVHGL